MNTFSGLQRNPVTLKRCHYKTGPWHFHTARSDVNFVRCAESHSPPTFGESHVDGPVVLQTLQLLLHAPFCSGSRTEDWPAALPRRPGTPCCCPAWLPSPCPRGTGASPDSGSCSTGSGCTCHWPGCSPPILAERRAQSRRLPTLEHWCPGTRTELRGLPTNSPPHLGGDRERKVGVTRERGLRICKWRWEGFWVIHCDISYILNLISFRKQVGWGAFKKVWWPVHAWASTFLRVPISLRHVNVGSCYILSLRYSVTDLWLPEACSL